MGLRQSNEGSDYLTLVGGKMVQRTTEKTLGALRREIEVEGKIKIIWELSYGVLDGRIYNIEFVSTKYGPKVEVSIIDLTTKEQFKLQLPMKSKGGKAFLCSLPNVDLSKDISISVWGDDPLPNGKIPTALCVWQDEKTIKQKWTKDNMEDCPAWESIIVDNEEKWDKSKQITFIGKYITEKIIPNIPHIDLPERDLLEDINPVSVQPKEQKNTISSSELLEETPLPTEKDEPPSLDLPF